MGDSLTANQLLSLAQRLQSATNLRQLLHVAADEVEVCLGYRSVWLCVLEDEGQTARLLAAHGEAVDDAWEKLPVMDLRKDAFLRECMLGDRVVVVEDARTDPRTDKQMVAYMGNVSIVILPLRWVDQPLGALGMGTFGDEDVHVPSEAQLNYLVQIGSQLSVAASRIRLEQERQAHLLERRELEERLYAAQRMQSLGLFAGGIAHDFNNLLSVIMGVNSLLTQTRLDDAQRRHVDTVQQAGERAADLVAQLLSMSRNRPTKIEPVAVGDRLQQLVHLVRRVVPSNVQLRLEPVDPQLWLRGDAARIDQVLMNLCINARDAMPTGGTLRISADGVRESDGDYVRVRVSDTGEGIEPDVRERIFDPLFTTKQDRGGTGLGLAVVKSIMEQHAGSVECNSSPGQGCTFTLRFPRTELEPAGAPSRSGETETPGGPARTSPLAPSH